MSRPPRNLVLYADDDPDDRFLVEELFAPDEADIQLVTFANGQELLDYLGGASVQAPCLVILDLSMPVLNGVQTLAALRASDKWSATPVVLFTTSIQPADIAFAESLNAAFVTKPVYEGHAHQIVDQMRRHCCRPVTRNGS
jgi:CheY-like chemotaxis protein